MARKVNYSKKIEKIKAQLDELGATINSESDNTTTEVESPELKIKLSDIDLGKEDNASLIKLQKRIIKELNNRLNNK